MYEDAECIRNELERLVEDGTEVIVVLHSYGGVVGTEAVHESLGKKQRAAEGKKGGVIGLLYMCAFVLPEGVSIASAFGGQLPPYIVIEVSRVVPRSNDALVRSLRRLLVRAFKAHFLNDLL